ncbi:MAG: hemerythrin domain-containing protein [Candidatus Falkowbacteria bacterium]
MLPIAPLMIEHRLIEKMIGLLSLELKRLKEGGQIDREFNRSAADFFRVYADKTHHGKEEHILFRELRKKEISPEHSAIMEELISEHIEARRRVSSLVSAETEDEAITNLEFLVELYPRHIAREDKEFFIPVMEYFSETEKEAMLREGEEFDQKMIHEKYKTVIEELSKNS